MDYSNQRAPAKAVHRFNYKFREIKPNEAGSAPAGTACRAAGTDFPLSWEGFTLNQVLIPL
jgi:hypothetical protein